MSGEHKVHPYMNPGEEKETGKKSIRIRNQVLLCNIVMWK
jgi:hypothetical protein